MSQDPKIEVTERAVEALLAQGYVPGRSFLVIQHVLGCGGAGFRLAMKDRADSDFMVVTGPSGIRIAVDAYSAQHLTGAVVDYGETEDGEGFRLDHPAASFAAFC